MENVILFRGRHIDSGNFVYGYYVKHNTACAYGAKHYIVYDDFVDWGIEPQLKFVEVDPETVSRYTGRRDAKGQMIFEDDCIGCNFYTDEHINSTTIVMGDDFTVDYDEDRGMYRVRFFEDNRLTNECWFDAYERDAVDTNGYADQSGLAPAT